MQDNDKRVFIEDNHIVINVKRGYMYNVPELDYTDNEQVDKMQEHLLSKRWMNPDLFEEVIDAFTDLENIARAKISNNNQNEQSGATNEANR